MLAFVGDLHGRLNALIDIFDRLDPALVTAVIQVGDFGIVWPGSYNQLDNFFHSYCSKIQFYFCDGNHENHAVLDRLYDEQKTDIVTVSNNCYHVRRGTTLMIDELPILFMGGARSHTDKESRPLVLNKNWWPREVPSASEFHRFQQSFSQADIIVSHDCPSFLMSHKDYYKEWSQNGVTQFFDSTLRSSKTKPARWFFGHHHDFDTWNVDDIDFYCCGKHGEAWLLDKKTCVKFGSNAVD